MHRVQLLIWPCLALAIAVPGSASAGNEPLVTYPPLKPVAIRPVRNAARVLAACEEAEASRKTDCPAYRFCKDPLILENIPLNEHQVVEVCGPLPSDDKAKLSRQQRTAAPSTTSFGSTWQSEVLSGLAMFLEERAKAEALASFAYQLKTQLCTTDEESSTQNAAKGTLKEKADQFLPATCAVLNKADPYAGEIVWAVLKAAFETDLRALPERVIVAWAGDDPGQPLIALIQATTLLERGDDPFQILAGLRQKYDSINAALCGERPRACYLRLLGSIAEIFAPLADARAPFAASDDELPRYFEIAARLLYEEARPVGLLQDLPAKYASYERAIQAILRLIDEVRTDAIDASSDRSNADKAIRYMMAVAAVLEQLPVNEIAPTVARQIDPAKLGAVLDHLARALGHVRAGEYVQGFVELEAALNAAEVPVPPWFTKYGGFLAEVAAARDKDEAKQAFESAAAPVGAWRAKRGAGHRALTLNGYVGVQGGLEWLGGDTSPSNRALHGGLFAPVGLEADVGMGKAWSLGVLFSAIDLGALLDFRESTTQMTPSGREKVDTSSNVGVRQVFSPGIFGLVGVGGGKEGVPITLGAGFSLAPELRSIGVEGGTSKDLNALRINVFAAIDVTIFGF